MRDIREDLQERLDAIGRDREELKRRLSDLETVELAIQALFKRETETFTSPLPQRTERSFESYGAKDDGGVFNAKEGVNGFGGKEAVVNYPQYDAVGGVKASHWGEFKVS